MNRRLRHARIVSWIMLAVTAPGLIVNPAVAATKYWDGGGADVNWNTAANWDGPDALPANDSSVSGDTATFSQGSYVRQPTVNVAWGIRGLSFGASSAGITISAGNTLTIGDSGITVDASSPAHTINSPITLGAAQSWLNNSVNTLTVGGAIANGGYTLTITGSGTTTISVNIAGGGGITKTGDGTWNATYAPGTDQGYSFTGPVVVEGGNVETTTTSYVGTFKNASSVTIGGGAIATQLKVNNLAGLFYVTRKTVTLKTNGKLTMSNNNTVHLFDLTFEGGELASGTGRYGTFADWQLNGDITVTANTTAHQRREAAYGDADGSGLLESKGE